MTITKFYQSLKAPLTNSRWSWGAVGADNCIYLSVWVDDIKMILNRQYVWIGHAEPPKANLGAKERSGHVQQILDGIDTYLIMCECNIHGSTCSIKSFDTSRLFYGGALHQDAGGDWWISIGEAVEFSEILSRGQ